jgi:eukaryotic-like serine/threonine-protein kinase
LLTVFYLNSRDVFHRDLKPANFLIKREANGKNYLHLSDFGLAKNILDKERKSSSINSVKGTSLYLPPEIHKPKEEKPNIKKLDVWAIGIIAYELCTFKFPFKLEPSNAMIKSIINDPPIPI